MMQLSRRAVAVFACTCLALLMPGNVVHAQQPSSANYSTNEYFFGTGGETDLNSANYKARGAAGSLGVGGTSSTNFTANAGSISPEDEYLEFVVNASTVDLGLLSIGSTQTGTATFYVKAYVANGYAVKNASPAPRMGSYTMASPSSATASAAGTEQFGINLVANTSPTTFGAAAVQVPDNTFSFGAAAAGYNSANQYKYVNGETIAEAMRSTGQTTFTISYIMNIDDTTPGGTYAMNHILVATGTY